MKVRELIVKLLDEPMDAEVELATQRVRKAGASTEVVELSFHIDKVEHWNYSTYLRFTDWDKGAD